MFSLCKKINTFVNSRCITLGITLFCVYLLAFAFVLEYFVELTPCPLCIAQRIFFFLISATAAAFYFFPKVFSQKLVAVKMMLLALVGGGIAARQVWMQWYPGTIDPTRCGVSFGSFIDQFLTAMGGSGDCATVDWTFLTLSIAEWSLLSFIALLGAASVLLWRAYYNKYEHENISV